MISKELKDSLEKLRFKTIRQINSTNNDGKTVQMFALGDQALRQISEVIDQHIEREKYELTLQIRGATHE